MISMRHKQLFFTGQFLFLLLFSVNIAYAETTKIIYVSKAGSDNNDGSLKSPLLTISKAETIAQAGDEIIIHKGTYREMITLNVGGTSENTRITYNTAPNEQVKIKGSEQIRSWTHVAGNTWRVEINEDFFKGFNPFAELISKDSSYMHLGEVYIDNKALREKKALADINSSPGSWFTAQENGKTIIIANFGIGNPNLKLVEINVRAAAFVAEKSNINYITLKGFNVEQVAAPMATINGRQSGAISLNGGTHWTIENCMLRDCKSVAISIGQIGHSYPRANYSNPEFRDLSQDTALVGHDIILHNHIFNCGQAGIYGLLHGSFSEIENNLIEDINSNNDYPGGECAGIRLALAVDAQVIHNLIRNVKGKNAGYGIFLGPTLQGTRISRNVISGTQQRCLFLLNSHGPVLIDNNIFSGPGKATDEGIKMLSSEANVFVQNLFYDCGFANTRNNVRSAATSNFLPHSLVIKQTIPLLSMDDRWFGNIFIKGGLDQVAINPDLLSDYNVYLDGALPSSWGDRQSKVINADVNFKLSNSAKGVSLMLNNRLIPIVERPVLTAQFIGFFALSKEYIEYPDGKAITIDHDFNNTAAGKEAKMPGPFYQYSKANVKAKILFTY